MSAYRSWVEVSRQQIADNFQAVRQVVGESVEVMPVVKADAYRHGAVEVSRVLEREGTHWLAVSSVEEGVALREAGIHTRILVMADFLPSEREALLHYELTPAIHSLEDLSELDRLARLGGKVVRYHLKIDTGLGRLGTSAGSHEIVAAVLAYRAASLEGLMTHFASAANYGNPQTDEQMDLFEKVTSDLRGAGVAPAFVHLSASTPIAYGRKRAWGNMVRPGHAIYGYVSPLVQPRTKENEGSEPQRVLNVKPALTWKAAVLELKDVPEGSLIGYGGMHRTQRRTRIAVLAAGYADGIPHRLSSRGKVIAKGTLVPVLGAVSMDLTTIDVTDCPALKVGDAVTLLGREGTASIDAQQIARAAGTISYSVLCGISARVKRVYV